MAGRNTGRGLARVNPTAAFLVVAALMFAGLALPSPYGGVILLALAIGLAALLVRTWSAHGAGGRLVRMVMLGALVVVAALRLV